MSLPASIQNLIEQFNKLPGIGPKTAERFVFFLLKQPKSEIDYFLAALNQINSTIKICQNCFDYADKTPCALCSDPRRDKTLVCVVASSTDVIALEKTNEFNGLYHVLGGYINEIDGVTPDKLKIQPLITRLKKDKIKEVIIALDPTIEGETTALYLAQELKPFNIKITRLARGLPMGSDIEYADEITLSSALKDRKIL